MDILYIYVCLRKRSDHFSIVYKQLTFLYYDESNPEDERVNFFPFFILVTYDLNFDKNIQKFNLRHVSLEQVLNQECLLLYLLYFFANAFQEWYVRD